MRVVIAGAGDELTVRAVRSVAALPGVEAVTLLADGEGVGPPPGAGPGPSGWVGAPVAVRTLDPADRAAVAAAVATAEPTAVVHLGVAEPGRGLGEGAAVARTAAATVALADAVGRVGSVARLVVRSGLEVYGRRRGAPVCPDEAVVPDPTTAFGHSLRHVEQVALAVGRQQGLPVTVLRFAPLVGAHGPGPLASLLRLPLVPVAALGDPPFCALHPADGAAAVSAALALDHDGPLNVVAPGAMTVAAAARCGGRLPVPVLGPGWRAARTLSGLVGAPIPDHVRELVVRGRAGAGGRVTEVLGWRAARATPEVVEHLFAWPALPPVPAPEGVR